MKALTLTQPWATLVAIGAKKIETRGWKTDYRGPLAIHAAKGIAGMDAKEYAWLCMRTEPFRSALFAAGYTLASLLPRGVIVATCRLVSVREITPAHANTEYAAALTGWRWTGPGALGEEYEYQITPEERAFGDYSPGRYAWLLADVKALASPVPARGALGLWEWR